MEEMYYISINDSMLRKEGVIYKAIFIDERKKHIYCPYRDAFNYGKWRRHDGGIFNYNGIACYLFDLYNFKKTEFPNITLEEFKKIFGKEKRNA